MTRGIGFRRLQIEGLWLARRSSVSRALGSPLRTCACGRVDVHVHSCSMRVVRPSCSVCGWLAAPYARDRLGAAGGGRVSARGGSQVTAQRAWVWLATSTGVADACGCATYCHCILRFNDRCVSSLSIRNMIFVDYGNKIKLLFS